MPLAQSVGKNKYLLTLRDSFAMIMPLLVIGSMFTLVANFPIDAWIAFVKSTTINGYTLKELISIPAGCTVSLMAIFIAFNIGYNFSEHEGVKDHVSAGIISLTAWLVLMPQVTQYTPDDSDAVYKVASLPLGWLGAKGVFIAILVGFLSVKLFSKIVSKGWEIKMPEGVPPTVSRAFSALIPMAITIGVVWAIRLLFILTPWGDAFSFIYTLLQTPLQALGGTVWAQTIIYLFAHLLWFFGIHGTNITDSVYMPVLLSLSAENQSALAAGMTPVNIINYQFETLFATFGGAGSTLSLMIAAIMVCRSQRIRKLAKLSLGPCIFEINEPVIFGLPIVLNPIMFIPFLAVPVINILTTYGVMAAGIVPVCNGVMLPWTTPPIISGFLTSGWQGAVWQAVLIVVGVFLYMPFIKTLDKQYLEEEAAAEKIDAASGSDDLDSVDLDSIEF
jgi:PTS system cellobiose-specific IIC component